MPGKWSKELPEDDPIFGGTHFTIYAGPLLTVEELVAARAHDLDDEVEFVSPRIPGRMSRGAPAPEDGGEAR